MIYQAATPTAPLTQGDLIDNCPLIYWVMNSAGSGGRQSASSLERVVVLTQACDLANTKTTRVQVAVVYEAASLVDAGLLKGQMIRDQIRRHRVFGWYFLPQSDLQPEAIVDLHDLHTLPRGLLEDLIADGNRVATIQSPFREHLAQHFAVTYSRIALPEPYDTEVD